MISNRRANLPLPLPLVICMTLVSLLLAALVIVPGSADASYAKPKTGTWKTPKYFDYIKGGSMKVAKKGKNGVQVKSLVLKLAEGGKSHCGVNKIKLRKPVAIKRFKQFNGRWAVGKAKNNLIEAKGGVKFKIGKKNYKGTLKLIFEDDGKLATSGFIETEACNMGFFARK